MEFITKLLATLAGMSSTSTVALTAITVVLLVVVYFKYIKPAFMAFVENQKKVSQTREDICHIKNVATSHCEDAEVIQELLQGNSSYLEDMNNTLKDMRTLMKKISEDVHIHDKEHSDRLTNMLIEMNRLSTRLEADMIFTRGVK